MTVEDAAELAKKPLLPCWAAFIASSGHSIASPGGGRVFGMVNTVPGFDRHPAVINGFSKVILDVFGPDTGRHCRSAVGMTSLPMNFAVEIEAQVLIG